MPTLIFVISACDMICTTLISSTVQNNSSSSIQETSLILNLYLVKTTLPSLCLDSSTTVTSTLIIFKVSGINNFSSTKLYQQDANKYLGKKMDNKFLSLMLLDEFLNKYLLLDNTKLACLESNWPEIYTRMKKVGMYILFVSITFCSCELAHTEM